MPCLPWRPGRQGVFKVSLALPQAQESDMGAQSTLHVTYEAARKAFQDVVGEKFSRTVHERLGEKDFERLLDHVLSDSLYNVLLIDQARMDEAWDDYYARTFGNYDPSGATLRYQLECEIKEKGLGHALECFRRVATPSGRSPSVRY